MLSKKNIRPGNFKYNFFILIFFFVVFMFFEVKSNDNIDGSNIDLKILDKISSKNELINLNIGEEFIYKDL